MAAPAKTVYPIAIPVNASPDALPERNDKVPLPRAGELILIRVPPNADVDPIVSLPASTVESAAAVSSIVNGRHIRNNRTSHPCVVLSTIEQGTEWSVVVLQCRGFTKAPDACALVAGLATWRKDRLLPLPFVPAAATPALFGQPLDYGVYRSNKPGWIVMKKIVIRMGTRGYRPFEPRALLPAAELNRLNTYLATLPALSPAPVGPCSPTAGPSLPTVAPSSPHYAGFSTPRSEGPGGRFDTGFDRPHMDHFHDMELLCDGFGDALVYANPTFLHGADSDYNYSASGNSDSDNDTDDGLSVDGFWDKRFPASALARHAEKIATCNAGIEEWVRRCAEDGELAVSDRRQSI